MKIQKLSFHSYEIPLVMGSVRTGVLVNLIDSEENSGWGEVAPLPRWSRETLEDSCRELNRIRDELCEIEWTKDNCFEHLRTLDLLPSVLFGVETALLALLDPLPEYQLQASALLMGSTKEILEQADLRRAEGYQSAKLKVGHLGFTEAARMINHLKDVFRLRIDVNRAWETKESLQFFSQFSKDAFDYVEEPFRDPCDLALFTHPLAVDESFPGDLSLSQLEVIPTLKSLIYKPTMQGGLMNCVPLHQWAMKRGVSIVLSSSFESDVGLAGIASIARRLSIVTPLGVGTYFYMDKNLSNMLTFAGNNIKISEMCRLII